MSVSTKPEIQCNLCGDRSYKVKFAASIPTGTNEQGHYLATTDLYGSCGPILQCRGCGLVYADPQLTDSEILSLYANSEDEEYRGEGTSRSINAHFSLNTILRFAHSGKLLDIGCSTGYFLNAARLHFDVQGVEPSVSASQYAREQLLLKVHTGTLHTAQLQEHSFGTATMIDAIEHFPDPRAMLNDVHRILVPAGFLYVVTPDIGSLTARLLGKSWWGLRPAHLYYFSVQTLSAMLNKAGFDVLLTQSFGRAFTGQYWVSRLKNYSPFITRTAMRVMDRLGFSNKVTYINTFDSIEIVARKR